MSLVSLKLFLLVGIALICYYVLPMKCRWCVLLASSLMFYWDGGWKAIIAVLGIALFAFYMAIWITKAEKGKKQKVLLSIAVVGLISVLAFVKICKYYQLFVAYIIVPVGISYFTLSIVGYLLDVYWNKDAVETNFGHFLTFVFFFPKIIQGPISRHKLLGHQLTDGKHFDYENICFGLQLVIWGIFKKIVIADRLDIVVSSVYDNLNVYEECGLILMGGMIASALQLYFDFSGYTDMALGIAQMFGIELEHNFNHPFFAKSASEFWQRWHMTLSGWFKDYLFLPVSRSQIVKKLSKKMGNRFGSVVRKKTMMVCSTAVVWFATGLWHGTGVNYIVWGVYWGTIIIFSEVFSSWIQKLTKLLCINTSAVTWKVFQMLRTSMIFVVGKMISAQNSLLDVKRIVNGIIKHFYIGDINRIGDLGATNIDWYILVVGILICFSVSVMQENGIRVRRWIAGWNAIPRWIFYSISITVILLFGLYGVGYDVGTFEYQFF